MNIYGSYRALRDNATAAILAAIEIYNKPQFSYRSECFVILLVNAWELLLKAILSKNRQRIFKPKLRNRPYLTFDIGEALEKVKPLFPKDIPYKPVCENIGRLIDYRNNSIHFYNEPNFGIIIYGLAQTSIVNFRDLALALFKIDIADEVNLSLLPLSFGTTPDPIQFIQKGSSSTRNPFVAEYLKVISKNTVELESEHLDTGRFLTVFEINLQSTKKISASDVVAGVKADDPKGRLLVTNKVDPNKTHPKIRKDILEKIGNTLNGVRFTSHTFEAIAWKYKIKTEPRYSWRPEKGGGTIQYSPEVVAFLRSLRKKDIEQSLTEYKKHLRTKK